MADAGKKEEEEKENEPPKEGETKKGETKQIVHPTDNFFRLDVEVCLKCKSCGYSRYVFSNVM